MSNELFPMGNKDEAKERAELAPEQIEAWRNFSRTVFKKGVLDPKIKQLIAVAVGHVTQCPYCIKAHVPQALRAGATEQEIMEAIWVAAEMRAGAGYSHSVIAYDAIKEYRGNNSEK